MNRTLQRLGFEPRDRVLIIHADDIGMSSSTVSAMNELFALGTITSASAMVPCPWFPAVVDWRVAHPDADLGVHLTLNSEWVRYRWRPLSGVGSRITDDAGYLHATADALVMRAEPGAVQCEMSAQVEIAVRLGLCPTHLDTHMLAALRAPFLEEYVNLGFQHGLPVLLPRTPPCFIPDTAGYSQGIGAWEERGMPVLDHLHVVTQAKRNDDREALVREILESLPMGLSCLLLHCVADGEDFRHVSDDGQSRVADYKAFRNPRLLDRIRSLGIHLMTYRELMKGTSLSPAN